MHPGELSGPDLDGVVADANSVGLRYVVIGGFSVIAHGYLRATRDSDLLVPDGPVADAAIRRFLECIDASRLHDGERLGADDIEGASHLRVTSRHGIVDILRGGLPPLTSRRLPPTRSSSTEMGRPPRSPHCEASSASSGWRGGGRIASTSRIWKGFTGTFRSIRSRASIHS
jgi:hypothetical protein